MKKTFSALCALLSLSTSWPAGAGDANFVALNTWWQAKTWRPIIAFSAGSASSNTLGKSQSFPITLPAPLAFYAYQASHSTQTALLNNLFIGAEWQLMPNWLIDGGVAYSGSSVYTARGRLDQGADAISADVYHYQYQVFAEQWLLTGKLLYSVAKIYHPYLMVGMGFASNKAYDFKTTVPAYLTLTRHFADHWESSFTYALGTGLDIDIHANVRLGLGYRYADIGAANLGSAIIDKTPVAGSLAQAHIYSHQVLAQVTWLLQ